MTVNIKVGAQLDLAGPEARLDQFTRKINSTGQSIAKAGGVKFDPIPKATVQQMERVEQTMRNIAKLAPQVAERLKASGQASASLFDVDWSRAYANPVSSNRAARGVFSLATGLNFADFPAPPARSPPGGSGGPPGLPPRRPPAAPAAPAGGGPGFIPTIMQRGLTAAGPVGGVAAQGLRAGMSGGLLAGAAGFAGGLAALGIGALIGGVRQYVGAAQQESIGYDSLRNRLGGTGSGIGFYDLRRRMRRASDETATTYEEAQQLGGIFARRGNSRSADGLADDVTQSAGFARSFGFDPSAGVSAFAGLRGVGVTRNVDESRRLGLAIAEGIARAGVFAKAEEYLQEIAGFSEQQTRASLSRANAAGFAGAMTGLINQNQPGLDVHGAAALLGRANSAIAGGGAAGEAGQAFLYQAVGRRLGLGNPIDTHILQQGGAFATGRSTFGAGTVAGDYYRRNGIDLGGAAESDLTNFQMVQEGLRSRYRNPRLLLNATANVFGINESQAIALSQLRPAQLDGMRGLLSPEMLRSMSATGIQTTARIATGSRDELDTIADEFSSRGGRGALSADERRRLTEARNGGTEEEFRKLLAEISAGRQQEETEGSRTRRTIQDLEKALTGAATNLLGPLNTARDALLVIAGRGGSRAMTASEVRTHVRDAQLAEVDESQARALAGIDGERTRAADAYARAQGLAANNPGDVAAARAADEARSRLEAVEQQRVRIIEEHEGRRAAARRAAEPPPGPVGPGATLAPRRRSDEEFAREFGPAAERVAAQRGVPASWVLAHWSVESHNGRSFAGRNNPANLTGTASEDTTSGADTDGRGNPIRQRFLNFGSPDEMADRYSRWIGNRSPGAAAARSPTDYFRELQRGGYATSPNFVSGNAGAVRRFDGLPTGPGNTPMPAGAPPGAVSDAGRLQAAAGDQRVMGNVEGVFRLEDQRGNELAQPVRVDTGWRFARPFGAGPGGLR